MTTSSTSAALVAATPMTPIVDTQIQIDQTQIINLGIQRKEGLLDKGIHDMENKLRPLIARHQELNQEIQAALPKVAEKACEAYKAPLSEAFKILGAKVKFDVSNATIVDGRGQASFRVSDAAGSSYGGISQTVPFELTEDIQAKLAAVKTLDLQLAAGRAHQVELKKALQNLPREERALKGALAEKVLSKTEQGREFLDVINNGMIAIPEAPDLLLLGDGKSASAAPKRAKRAASAKRAKR